MFCKTPLQGINQIGLYCNATGGCSNWYSFDKDTEQRDSLIESDWPVMVNWGNSSSRPFVLSLPFFSSPPLLALSFSLWLHFRLKSELNVNAVTVSSSPSLHSAPSVFPRSIQLSLIHFPLMIKSSPNFSQMSISVWSWDLSQLLLHRCVCQLLNTSISVPGTPRETR